MTKHHHHPNQPDTEDEPFSHFQVMTEAVVKLLIEKEVVTPNEFRIQLEKMDATSPADGAKMVARAWTDPEFKIRMMTDVKSAAQELGLDAGHIPIQAVENTPEIHNIIVCTLCSCYPRLLIGLPPDWYKSRAYRARTVREPRVVLAEFGTQIPNGVEVRVHDSTADLRYLVLPMQPPGSEDLSEDNLARLVTRDSLIGVSFARSPE